MNTFDFRGLQCPLPVLRANKALRPLPVGTEVRILATDPAAPKDFQAFCATAGHTLVDCRPDGEGYELIVRKGG